MENSTELNGKYLGTITTDFVKASTIIKEAAYQIRMRKISEYPIFVMCKEVSKIGGLILPRGYQENQWNFNASFFEEFLQRGLIGKEGVEIFKENYKNPEEFCCVFVMDTDFMNYVFLPYPEDDDDILSGEV